MVDNSSVQESWNMGTETLKRLSRCLNMCSYFSQKKDLSSWYNACMDLKRNLYPFLIEDEFKIINDKLNLFPALSNGRVLPNNFSKSYKILDSFYLSAIKYMKAKGLLMPKTTDPRAAVISN